MLNKSLALQERLEINLKKALPMVGLMTFIKGWKQKVTPAGRQYCQLAVSVRPISVTDCGLWPTMTANEANGSAYQYGKNKKKILKLTGMCQSMWPTPSTRDHKDTGDLSKSQFRKDGKERNDTLGRQAYGSTAQTKNKGSLNPAFPCWLMGYPQEWLNCAPLGTRLSHK